MEVIAAAGLCAPGCGAAIAAFAGGPILGAVSMAAAVGYGIFSFATGKDDKFQDAIEGESDDVPAPVVKIARYDQAAERPSAAAGTTDSSSFL
jgi:hypothetical protein